MADTNSRDTVFSLDHIIKLRSGMSNVVLVGGVFDILHAGHVKHLEEASKQGDTLIVHVTSDERVREKKGANRPIVNQNDRASIIASIRYVDYVFIADKPHYYQEILDAVQPDVLFFNQEAYSPAVNEYMQTVKTDADVVVSDLPHNKSTTEIIRRIKAAFKDD